MFLQKGHQVLQTNKISHFSRNTKIKLKEINIVNYGVLVH